MILLCDIDVHVTNVEEGSEFSLCLYCNKNVFCHAKIRKTKEKPFWNLFHHLKKVRCTSKSFLYKSLISFHE